MRFADINKIFTAKVAEYIGKGYVINTVTMSGSQGEIATVDLTNGTEIIRVLVDDFRLLDDLSLEGVQIIVGRATGAVTPNSHSNRGTIWNNELDVISREQFFEVGENRRHGKYYGTKEEATAAREKAFERWKLKDHREKTEDVTEKAMPVAVKIIRDRLGVSRVIRSKVQVKRRGGRYVINYCGNHLYIGCEKEGAR